MSKDEVTMETRLALVNYPVRIEVDVPARFERMQVALRLAILVALVMLFQSGVLLYGLSYLLLPLVAVLLIQRHGGEAYLQQDAPRIIDVLEWFAGFCAYMLFATDSLPLDASRRPLRLRVNVGGAPSVRGALTRYLSSLPHFILLALVGVMACVLAVIAAIGVVLNGHYSNGMRSFQQEYVGWLARALAYHASLVADFPPLTIDRTSAAAEPDERYGEV
jgi:hypothetical protein